MVLDLDGDGIELSSLDGSTVFWDIDEDGMAERSGWVDADDGLLAIDLNGNGIIDSQSELFGNLTTDGFTELALLDSNSDGVIDSNDAEFANLIIWQDTNQNGISAVSELHSLADFNITSISLSTASPSGYEIEGHEISHVASYTIDDGINTPITRNIVDVWFNYNNGDTLYNLEYDLDGRTLSLPQLRGYGDIPNLNIQASIDNDSDDPNSLMSLLQGFSDLSFNELTTDPAATLNMVQDIMFRWAGVDNLDPTSRGEFADARKLEFLEKLVGEQYLQQGSHSNPGSLAADAVHRAFDFALYPIAGKLIAQAAGASLFNDGIYYNPATDTFEGFTAFNQDVLDQLLTMSLDGAVVDDKTAFWVGVVNIIDSAIGVSNLSTTELNVLNTTLAASDPSLDADALLERILWNHDSYTGWVPQGDSLVGTTGVDVYDGTVGDDYYSAGAADDIIDGGLGDDILYGGGNNDHLTGGLGDDYLKGDAGDDTFYFSGGHGNDTVSDSGGTDTIVFADGITLSDLTITRTGSYSVLIEVASSAGGGSITIENQVNGLAAIDTLSLSGGAVVDLVTYDHIYIGDDTDETVKGAKAGYGGSGNDTIYGNGGDDIIYGASSNSYSYTTVNFLYGGTGNDTLYGDRGVDYLYGGEDDDTIQGSFGNDFITGGLGNDYLDGDRDDDTYFYNVGDGNDIISEHSGTDVVIFGEGITLSDLTITRVGSYDVLIDIASSAGGGSITIENQVLNTTAIENLQLFDNTVIDLLTYDYTYFGDETNETIRGVKAGYAGAGNDTIYGYGGDDIIYGASSNSSSSTTVNFLYGGTGNDTLYGDRGVDYLYGEDGDDIIYGSSGDDFIAGGNGTDILKGENGADTFIFDDTALNGIDTIQDFKLSQNDKIDVSDLLEGYDPLTDAISDFIQITDDGSNSTLAVDVDGGGDNFVTIATLTAATGLTDEAALEASGNLIAA